MPTRQKGRGSRNARYCPRQAGCAVCHGCGGGWSSRLMPSGRSAEYAYKSKRTIADGLRAAGIAVTVVEDGIHGSLRHPQLVDAGRCPPRQPRHARYPGNGRPLAEGDAEREVRGGRRQQKPSAARTRDPVMSADQKGHGERKTRTTAGASFTRRPPREKECRVPALPALLPAP